MRNHDDLESYVRLRALQARALRGSGGLTPEEMDRMNRNVTMALENFSVRNASGMFMVCDVLTAIPLTDQIAMLTRIGEAISDRILVQRGPFGGYWSWLAENEHDAVVARMALGMGS